MYHHAPTYEDEWNMPTPLTGDDHGGGTLIILCNTIVCPSCGKLAEQRMSFVWEETKRPDLVDLGIGESVKHYYTSCEQCGSTVS
jgi:hypothetical protein